ncbi:hypothetical protein EB796_001619 [Bugula neritina]|uniref:C2H2-type domain-containing protein n=1 Tax=Bugula neritina TaxID=10212 RepID=A0A7J7KPD2_BUGNE|nr:hypothetical protein EB796_001619 [Bugula neritina]
MEEQLFKQKSVVVLTDVLKKLKTVSCYKSNSTIRCPLCSFAHAHSKKELSRHIISIHGHICPFCKKCYSNKRGYRLYKHIIHKHMNKKCQNIEKKMLPEKQCSPSNTKLDEKLIKRERAQEVYDADVFSKHKGIPEDVKVVIETVPTTVSMCTMQLPADWDDDPLPSSDQSQPEEFVSNPPVADAKFTTESTEAHNELSLGVTFKTPLSKNEQPMLERESNDNSQACTAFEKTCEYTNDLNEVCTPTVTSANYDYPKLSIGQVITSQSNTFGRLTDHPTLFDYASNNNIAQSAINTKQGMANGMNHMAKTTWVPISIRSHRDTLYKYGGPPFLNVQQSASNSIVSLSGLLSNTPSDSNSVDSFSTKRVDSEECISSVTSYDKQQVDTSYLAPDHAGVTGLPQSNFHTPSPNTSMAYGIHETVSSTLGSTFSKHTTSSTNEILHADKYNVPKQTFINTSKQVTAVPDNLRSEKLDINKGFMSNHLRFQKRFFCYIGNVAKCNWCNEIMAKDAETMKAHFIGRHKEVILERLQNLKRLRLQSLSKIKQPDPMLISCSSCTFQTTNANDLQNHISSHHSIGLHYCKYCDYFSLFKCELIKHVSSFHTRKKCYHCPYVTVSNAALQSHIYTHHNM